ncbi:hypothetical protein ZYGR_0AV01590 [Zygosaccharomyces rouxii]|uniref:Exocyst complex component Sec3 PIP2-binding N-terminal domain-containing protein n=1 Tax=Zygosaccharomyces rouxii TaxID=4956 RepID=A0A1Q3AIH6_ZYGRO|nr:hypothetical protein ZYGR_0AV01590 [Zygosaccharomyces rouxii]
MMKSARSPFKRKSHSRDNSIEDRGFFHRRSTSGSNIPSAQHSRQASNGGLNMGPPVSGNNAAAHKRTASNTSRSSQSSNFLAEQYERDRRGILASCFSNDNKSAGPPNSYITHVRIIEDARYPSTRPALDSKLENKKKRILILSSKANNPKAVELHKGRENADGRFQIGRTWSLKELVAIERDVEVNEGFMLTMSKKYYWETNSAKERVVFIKSLVNTYMQAFDGHVPELVNWDLSMFYLDERAYQRAVIRNRNVPFARPTVTPSIGSASGSSSGKGSPGVPLGSLNTRITNPDPAVPSPKSPARAHGRSPSLNDQFVQNRQIPGVKPSPNVSGYSNSPTMSNDSNKLYDPHNEQQQQQQQQRQAAAQQRMWQQEQDQQQQQARQAHQAWRSQQAQKEQQARKEQMLRQQEQIRQQELALQEEQRLQHMARQAQFEREALQAQEAVAESDPFYSHPSAHGKRDFLPTSSPRELTNKGSSGGVGSAHNSPNLSENPSFNSPQQFPIKQPQVPASDVTQIRQNPVKQGSPVSMDLNEEIRDVPHKGSTSLNKQDNLLEDLNNALAVPSATNILSNDRDRSEELYDSVPSRKEVSPIEIPSFSIPQTEPLNTELASASKVVDDDAGGDLNASSFDAQLDNSNDLSFERGDEASFSNNMVPNPPHVYHEVSTIQEEAPLFNGQKKSVITAGAIDESPEDQKRDMKKDAAHIEDEELLGILADINWEMGDAADDLIEKLNIKMAETAYSLNNGLLSLENVGPSLLPYEKQVDKVCDKMNPVFSLFLMEMGNVAEDIEYIESQKNGLQIESANKKNLWSTLTELMNTVSLDDATLNELLNSPVSEKTLLRMESQLKSLFRALKAISGENEEEKYDLGNMQALKERRETYERVTEVFLKRLVDALSGMFVKIYKDNTTEDHLISFLNRLLVFSSLTLFCKDVDQESYNVILDKWITSIQVVYNHICERMISSLRRYKLDRREQPAVANENALGGLLIQWENYKKTRALPEVVPTSAKNVVHLKNLLESLGKLCICYQNFIDSFFHVSSGLDFEEYLEQYEDPNTRIVPLYSVKPMQSDRESALKEANLVSRIFRPNVTRMNSYFTSILRADCSRAPAIMLFLEEKIKSLESSNQEFLLAAMSQMLDQVKQLWSEYIEDEVVHLERAVINMSSRSLSPSVLGFVLFVKSSHDYISYAQSQSELKNIQSLESIKIFESDSGKLGNAIIKLLSRKDGGASMLEDVRGAAAEASGTDKIVTLLLNCYWLIEVLSMLNLRGSFDSTIQSAKKIFDSEKEVYAAFLLRDAMPKLTSFVHGASSLVGTSSQGGGANLGKSAAYSRQNLDNILAGYTSSEIDILVKRLYQQMIRHLSHESNDLMKGTLGDRLWSSIQGQTVSLYLKLYTLIEKHYKGALVRFTKNDIITAFERYKE